jgi:hypothetical protein
MIATDPIAFFCESVPGEVRSSNNPRGGKMIVEAMMKAVDRYQGVEFIMTATPELMFEQPLA